MSNYWAIAIGINQYQHFQPLLYAQWDAQALWDYWVKEGGIPHHQCLLLTDGLTDGLTAGMAADTDTPLTPTKDGIEKHLLQLGHHRLGETDRVWCFFSGYGVNIQGQDYLVPLDANPQQLEQTSITATQFFSTLQSFPSDRVLVLLDVKRMPDTDPEMRLGDDIARQAQKTGIATIVASQPDQPSHETLTLRQGLFTATVLEGLRTRGCSQLGQLAQYVQNRLPELSEYHWRPRQAAVFLLSNIQKQHLLLPDMTRQSVGAGVRSPQRPLHDPLTESLAPHDNEPSSTPTIELPLIDFTGETSTGETRQYVPPSSTPVSTYSSLELDNSDRTGELFPGDTSAGESSFDTDPQFPSRYPQSPDPTIQPHPAMPAPTPDPTADGPSKSEDEQVWQSIIWPGLPLIAAGVLAIVVLRNLDALSGNISPVDTPVPIDAPFSTDGAGLTDDIGADSADTVSPDGDPSTQSS